jgi:site-specific DNA recombinase
MTDKGGRAVIYARYSTDMQNPMSVRDQVALCRRRAKDKGLSVIEEFCDEAQSATSIERTSYNRMFDQMPNRTFDYIIAESWDRLVRDLVDGAKLYKHSDFYGVTIHVLDRGDIGLMDASISSLVAAMFLDGLAHKTRRGLSGKVSEGKSGGGLSYGYRVATDKNGQPIKGELEIDQNQANVVRRIFKEYANGVSPLKIATALNEDAIRSPRSRQGKGGHWKQNAINGNRERGTGILNNELYVGQRVWNRLRYSKDPTTRKRVSRLNNESDWIRADVPHLRIIDDQLWDAVKKRQEALSKKRDKTKSKDGNRLGQTQAVRRQKYLLSGLLECGQCGGKLTIAGSGSRRRYYCANNKEKGNSVCKGFKGLRQSDVEELVLSALRNELLKDEAYEHFKSAFERQLNSQSNEHRSRVVEIDKETRDLTARLDKLIATIEAGGHSAPIIARIKEIEQRQQELAKARNALTANHISLPRKLPSLYRSYVDQLAKTLSNEEVVGRAANELRDLIEKLTVQYDDARDEHTIEVSGNLTAMMVGANPSDAGDYQQSESSIKLVAGVGFEPTTFRL